ncbi:MAG: flagellar hook-basal body complex protein [Anaerolineaceae bacterium]|nr:flagellar hook-basal body complex protein [Anaerolineaceae bacterium]
MTASFTQMFDISGSSMLVNMLQMDTVSHNLANVNTIGYKASRLNFQELFREMTEEETVFYENENTSLSYYERSRMDGILPSSTQIALNPGDFHNSDRPLDLAISGEGFFGIQLKDGGIGYTRNGEFSVDSELNLVDTEGRYVVWDGEIPEGAKDFEVDRTGLMTVVSDGERVGVGNIPVYRFINPSGLVSNGGNLFLESITSGVAEEGVPNENEFGFIQSRVLEGSNVQLSLEMTNMVKLQRSFDLSVRAIQQSDQMLLQAVRIRT